MESMRVFNIVNHHLIEIDDVEPFNNGTVTTIWKWEVLIAVREDVYQGKAVAENRNVVIPWTTLTEENYLDEMKKLCQLYMSKQ